MANETVQIVDKASAKGVTRTAKVDTLGNLQVLSANYPSAGVAGPGTAVQASATVAATANSTALAAAAGKFTYITGFTITGLGATAGSTIAVTVTGPTTTLNYALTIPAGATVALTPLSVSFLPPVPAAAINTAVVVNVPSFGAGNTNSTVAATGFQL